MKAYGFITNFALILSLTEFVGLCELVIHNEHYAIWVSAFNNLKSYVNIFFSTLKKSTYGLSNWIKTDKICEIKLGGQ